MMDGMVIVAHTIIAGADDFLGMLVSFEFSVILCGFRDSVAKFCDKRQRVPSCCEVSPNVVVRVYGSCRNAIVSAEKVRPIGDPLDVEEATFNRTVVPYVCPKGGGKANSRCLKRYDV